tara:strand:+ start:73697 stop:73969 length:273 start_codon:yes stop_codon:yes gene_type:complete
MEKIETECRDCGGTGLYCGFAEPDGTAVICNGCSGTGCKTIHYKPFNGRKPKAGVHRVMTDGGMWMTRTGSESTVSIEEFYEKTGGRPTG